ncbi:MAG: hypothetical protein R3Y53_01940 [Bacillota bacterium]
MLKIEKTEVVGFEHAIRGMRNPKNSWDRSDSLCGYVGVADEKLMTQLRDAGSDHRKFMRMLGVYADITAPLYWWKEYDTYKVGTVANSCSTMHKIHSKDFTLSDFSHEHLTTSSLEVLENTITHLNQMRRSYVEAVKPNKSDWWQMIQLLPSSYNQKRTVSLSYEVLANMYHARNGHKLDEWHTMREWMEKLPQAYLITGGK